MYRDNIFDMLLHNAYQAQRTIKYCGVSGKTKEYPQRMSMKKKKMLTIRGKYFEMMEKV